MSFHPAADIHDYAVTVYYEVEVRVLYQDRTYTDERTAEYKVEAMEPNQAMIRAAEIHEEEFGEKGTIVDYDVEYTSRSDSCPSADPTPAIRPTNDADPGITTTISGIGVLAPDDVDENELEYVEPPVSMSSGDDIIDAMSMAIGHDIIDDFEDDA